MPSFTATIFALTTLLAVTHASAIPIPRDTASDAVGAIRSGSITYYNTQGGLGACGTTLSDSEPMVAVSATLYDQYTINGNPNNNALCGKQIKITSADGAQASTVTVRDRCVGCAAWDLDVTPVAFVDVVPGGTDVGRTTLSWAFVS